MQHLEAWMEKGNRIRLARAELKHRIASGDVLAADVIVDPPECMLSMALADLLRAQDHWGDCRARKLCRDLGIGGQFDEQAMWALAQVSSGYVGDVVGVGRASSGGETVGLRVFGLTILSASVDWLQMSACGG